MVLVKWFSIPLMYMIDAIPDTQIAKQLEREREIVEVSCFIQRATVVQQQHLKKQHAAFTKRATKTQPSLTTFQVQGKTILILSAAASGAIQFVFVSMVISDIDMS